jgi:PKD repeat protein
LSLGKDSTFCGGDSVVLKSNVVAQNYLWHDLTSVDSLVVNSSGTYWLKVIDANSCSATDTIAFTVNQQPQVNLGKDVYLCLSDTATLNAGSTNLNYKWWYNDSLQAATQPLLTATDSGVYALQVIDSIGCTNSDTVVVRKTSVQVFPRFLAVSEITAGDTVQFINLSYPMPLTYKWNFGDGNTSTDTMPTNAFYLDGQFKVKLVIQNAYCTDSVSKTITVKKKPKSDGQTPPAAKFQKYVELINAKVYPNPSSNVMNVEITLDDKSTGQIELYNLQGTRLAMDKFSGKDILKSYNVNTLSTGIYFFRILVGDQVKTIKVIKI